MSAGRKPWIAAVAIAAMLASSGAVVLLRVRRHDLGVATGLLFLFAVSLLGVLVAELVMTALGARPATRMKIRLLVGTSVLLLFGAELGLRYTTRTFHTYSERNAEPYLSPYAPDARRFRDYSGIEVLTLEKAEFRHRRRINTLGLTGDLPSLQKASGEYRIVALGDSFTEGVGAEADSTWLAVVVRNLSRRHPETRFTSINGGISGGDIFYAAVLFEDKLLTYRPDLVIAAVNTSDVSDVMIKGGRERFLADGTVAFRQPPRWEPLYALSFLTRAFLHSGLRYDWLLIPKSRLPEMERAAVVQIGAQLRDLRRLCAEHGAEFLLVTDPMEFQVRAGSYQRSGFRELIETLQSEWGPNALDLLRGYLDRGVMTPETAGDFYWRFDLHHNAKGYQAMGDAIAERIEELGVL